ncbi:hypothetical protein KSS87_023867 [Heliosperma pusillum]|nr:hypothetical protein KSS87_023867 [Heliosperma pusillum]
MANRTAITVASSITSYVRLLHLQYNRKLTMEFSTVIHTPRCLFLLSYFSSTCVDYPDYSATETTSSKQKKTNYTGRLTAVIDAANDRKPPPELRGHRNNVRKSKDGNEGENEGTSESSLVENGREKGCTKVFNDMSFATLLIQQ